MLPDLLHGDERKVRGDASYQEQAKTIHKTAPQAQHTTNRRVKKRNGIVDEDEQRKNRDKSRACAPSQNKTSAS